MPRGFYCVLKYQIIPCSTRGDSNLMLRNVTLRKAKSFSLHYFFTLSGAKGPSASLGKTG